MSNFRRTLASVIIAVALCVSVVAQPSITKIEPPNWWTGFTSPVMVLLYGDNLNEAKVSVSYPGVKIDKTQLQPDGKHAFVWLSIAKNTKPGTVHLSVTTPAGTTTAAALPLVARQSTEGRFQGITRDDVIYLIMPDRFADGDPNNNVPQGAAAATFDRKAAKAYHGGDFKGIQDHLTYFKDLGVTTLWLTPIVDNDNVSETYHGYGAIDLYSVEDHFGTLQQYQQLVAAAHQQGLKVLFDMVPNHVGPNHPWATSQPAPGWLHGTTQNHINTDYDYPPVTDPHAVEKNYRSALNGWFANVLPDLAQENPLVAEYLLQNAYWWMETGGLDGLRIDTFPYVPRTFWTNYLQRLEATYPNFFAVGEVYNFEPSVVSYFAGGHTGFDGIDTHLPTTFDFPMNSAIREVVNRNASAKKIVEVLRQDRLYPHPELLVNFIGNHDMKRFITDAGGSSAKLKLGFSLLLTLRGIPQIYSGDEIAMPGDEDPDNRRDFPGGFPGDPHNAFAAAGRASDEQDVYGHVQGLLAMRRDHPALRVGEQKHVVVTDDYYIFTRETSGERLLVAFYKGEAPQVADIDLTGTSIANAKAFLPLNSGPAASLQGTALHLQLAPQTVAIYRID